MCMDTTFLQNVLKLNLKDIRIFVISDGLFVFVGFSDREKLHKHKIDQNVSAHLRKASKTFTLDALDNIKENVQEENMSSTVC